MEEMKGAREQGRERRVCINGGHRPTSSTDCYRIADFIILLVLLVLLDFDIEERKT